MEMKTPQQQRRMIKLFGVLEITGTKKLVEMMEMTL